MDDLLEQPNTPSKPETTPERLDDAELSSGDEDEGPDWTKLPSSASRPVIPKRGDKDFEPIVHGGSGFQRHVLDRARAAMTEALKVERTTSSKSISYGIWYPNIARTHVTTARGIHFTSMGHSVARLPSHVDDEQGKKVPKRLELLPEEAIYLIERGSMFCWKAMPTLDMGTPGLEEMEGAPMTVQQAFTEMIGTEDLTSEKYQVFAYLKRLGYVVMRTKPPSPAYLTAAPYTPPSTQRVGILSELYSSFKATILRLLGIFKRRFNWWKPSLFHHGMTYPALFTSLRLLPSGHKAPLHVHHPELQSPSPYEIFYNVYKPATPFKKTAPPKPDFQVVVVNARSTPMPTLTELTNLFDVLPELPPPVPRRRLAFADQKLLAQSAPAPPAPRVTPPPPPPPTFLRRFFSWALPVPPPSAAPPSQLERKPNPFAVLKQGKKMVVIAIVDSGMTSFFSFRQGGFEELPMV